MIEERDKLEDFYDWCKTHMSLFEAFKKKFVCAANDDEIVEVMAELFFAGEQNWDNLMCMDDGK